MEPQARSGGLVGRVLGGFVVREPLSSGGFGAVYRAEQPALAREAVIKVLHARLLGNETMVQRFLREARLASRLDHPYAAHIYAFGVEPDGLLWIAMELVRGTPLDQLLLAEGPISLDRFVPLLERICEVVHGAHEQGIVHRDLKPGNVMVLERSGRLLPKLLDFGIAKLSVEPTTERLSDTTPMDLEEALASPVGATQRMNDTMFTGTEPVPQPVVVPDSDPHPVPDPDRNGEDVTRPRETLPASQTSRIASTSFPTAGITQVGTTVGSPLYMAPEQWTDAALTSARTDIYALGILCYEALTSRPPFRGRNPFELAMAHGTQPVPPLGPGFPPALDAVLGRALEKHPDDRYATALELAGAFRIASGLVAESVGLPRLEAGLRSAAMTGMPRPLALAIDAFDGARNAHQARDACWQLVRTAVRLVSVAALASHGHIADPAESSQPAIEEALRRLRDRHPSDAAWLALARELTRPFAAMRDAHPLPRLVELLARPTIAIDELLALRAAAGESAGASEARALELLDGAVPLLARLIEELSFLQDHVIAVPDEGGAVEEWVGTRRDRRRRRLSTDPLPPGRTVLLDPSGAVAVVLWPFVQVHAPAPGAPPALFLFDGKGRRSARLVALPDSFEHEDDALWETFGALFRDTPDSIGVSTPIEVCPFPGLAAFTGAEAGSFFGRERESEAFLNRLRVQPLLTVVGPSGAGKSSFVHAGVVPALPEGWTSVSLRPGPAPMVSLSARLDGLGLDTSDQEPARLVEALRSWTAGRGTCLVLVVDQLEELFTICADPDQRARFAEVLSGAARSADDPVRVIFTVRDDFLLRLESLAPLRARLGPGLQLLTTPLEPDLRRILTEPIRRAGYDFDDPALPDRIVAEVVGTPGALALLSFTASKLWELRDRRFRHITARAYQSLAGVGGALAQHAEATLQAMHSEQQRLVREVFRHAVTAEGTRAVLTRGELTEVLGSSAHAGHVIEKLLTARLLVVSDDEHGGERIEVTHEALLEAWPRLVGWRREDAEGARLRDQLRAASRQWEQRGRPSGLLWRGDALAEYRLWRPRYPGTLTAIEDAFAAASLADAARGRRLRRIALGAVFLGVAIFAVVLLIQNARVQRGARQMHSLLLTQYEDQGRRLLLGDDPVLALAYLHKASKLGAHGPAHDFLVAQAVRATDGQLFALPHDGWVGRVRFSPDGKLIATSGSDNQARLWDARDGSLRARLQHDAPVLRLEWSPSGDRIATGTGSGEVALWDQSGRLLHRLRHEGQIQSLVFLAGGTRLATATTADQVTIWDPARGERVSQLQAPGEHDGSLRPAVIAASPDGAQLASGDRAGIIHLWDVASGRQTASWQAHQSSVNGVVVSPDGRTLVSYSALENDAIVWDVASHQSLGRLGHRAGIEAVSFSPDGSRIATASDDRTAVIWEASTGKALASLGGHRAVVWSVVWNRDGSRIATASDDGTAVLWDASSGRRLARRVGHRGGLRDVSFDPKGLRMATASLDGRAIVWNTEPSQQVTPLVGHRGEISTAEFSPGGAHVLTACDDHTARIWDAATGRQLLVLEHPSAVVVARFSPDERRVATAGQDGVVRIWDARTGASVGELKGHTDIVVEVGWDASGKQLVSASLDGTARVWSIATGQLLLAIKGHDGRGIHWAGFHPSRPVLFTSGGDRTTRVWALDGGRELARFESAAFLQSSAFDRNGQRLASTTPSRTAQIWRSDSGAVEHELVGHLGNVMQAAWSADGLFVVTASFDGTARIWDVAHGELLAVLDHGDGWLYSAAFSPEGFRVVTAGVDGRADVWELPRLDPSQDLERVVRCRAPYDTEGDEIVPRMRQPTDCALVNPEGT